MPLFSRAELVNESGEPIDVDEDERLEVSFTLVGDELIIREVHDDVS